MDQRTMKAVLLGKRRLDAVAATIPAKDRSDLEAVLPVVDGPAEVIKLERARELKAAPTAAVEAESRG